MNLGRNFDPHIFTYADSMYSLTCETSLQALKNLKRNKENREECLEPQGKICTFASETV